MSDPENVNGKPDEEQEHLHITDKRRFDPQTYQRRQAPGAGEPAGGEQPVGQGPAAEQAAAEQDAEPDVEVDAGEVPGDFVVPDDLSGLETDTRVEELENQVRERTADLQRLQAEYVNYKRRVDRDRDLARQGGIEAVVSDLLVVLDNVRAAREHEDLSGGFKAVAEEVEKVVAKHGLVAYGEQGEPFDPQVHEALMHQPAPEGAEHEGPVVVAVLQTGYRIGDRILRPARVAVSGA